MLFERIKLEADEEILQMIRKHWWIITIETAIVAFFALLPLFLGILLFTLQPFGTFVTYSSLWEWVGVYRAEAIFLYAGWLLVQWIMLANFWTDYYLDLWAITNRRVVLVDQRGFFRRFISSFRLERLQDMNIEVHGVLATILDYGTIEAQTAGGSNEEFISDYMPKPRDIKATIIRAADKLTATQAAQIQTMKEQGL